MKKRNKLVCAAVICAAALLPASPAVAQDFSFDGAFDDSQAAAGAGDSLEIHGSVSADTRAFFSADDPEIHTGTAADIDIDYSGTSADGVVHLDIDPDQLEIDLSRLIDEAYLRYYGNGYDLELGFMKVVWGKGDQIHVVDVLNPNDYTDFYNPDYIERREAIPMLKTSLYLGQQGKLELAYLPTLTPDIVPADGLWAPREATAAASLAGSYVQYLALDAYSTAYSAAGGAANEPVSLAAATAAEVVVLQEYADGTALYPNTDQWEYGQAALRYTTSFAGIDAGALYYFGYAKQPSIQAEFQTPGDPSSTVIGLDIDYDRLHIFGLEASAAPAGFNLRGEAAYYMTEDFDGDDPAIHNHSFQYLAGLDRDIPLHNLNANLQTVGTYRLASDEISSASDVEYSGKDDPSQTLIALKISDSFDHEKLKPEIVGRYVIEEDCWMVSPSVVYSPTDELEFSLTLTIFEGDADTSFGQFDENDFVELGGKLWF